MGRVVGIDLGTTNSVVAVMEGGKPVVIANAEGMRTTPSVVGFSKEGERLVGQMARRQAVLDPQNTFYAVKRFMGRKYTELVADSKRVPYTIRKDDVGNIRIKCPRLQKEFAPEEVSAMILKKLAEEASRYLGEPVTGAVITVPAYFNDSQRQATRDAGRIAGLEVKRILNEPTAASLAYGLDRRSNQTILVFDLGGGTFDVSVLEVGDGVFQVKSTSGDTQLGGNDFDQRIVDWLAEQFLEQEGVDLRKDRQALQRLTEAAEKAKIELSGVTTTEINLPFITATADGPKHLETRLTRSQFEGLCNDLLTRLRGPVRQALRDAAIGPGEIDEVVLVGGSSRIPVVQELVRSFIDREPNQNVNPDEVVAVGAAIQAGILAGEVKDILLLDVTPLSLGLETIGGVMKKLIPRNTTIPVRRSDIFSTGEDNQTMVEVHVLQGEREMAVGNKSLGRFKLVGIPPAPRGIPQVQVAFDIDANGILQVTAMDRTTGREQSVTIQEASTLSQDEVNRMIREAEEYADADRQRKAKVEKRNRAEALTFQAERQLREATLDFGMQFVSPYRTRIDRAVQQVRDALNQNDDRGIDQAQADLQDALYDLNREVYQRNKEEEEQDSFFGAIKSFFTDDDEDYYYDDRRYGESRYGTSGSSWNDSPRYGSDRYGSGSSSWNDNRYERRDYSSSSSPSSNSWNDNNRYDRRDYGSSSSTPRNDDRYGYGSGANADRSNRRDYGSSSTPRNDDRYSAGSNNSWYSDRPAAPSPRYNDPYSASNRSTPRPDDRSPRDRGWDERESARSENRSSYSNASDRSSDYRPPAARPAERDRSERRPAARPPRNDRPNLYEDNWDDDDDWL
ncbi:molecular chaperone DnaK [Pantanalinema sp. GBBB05]|uniref:molecular chaperone DnaK n=1 Tax=Pantanalinema sp. GBBB05 TaxID=2604139 RepID=UPI001E0D0384|nr:molecular chaperone DnaK [Pantanalinema sp. GBBB05]